MHTASIVTRVGNDTFEVRDFLASEPNVSITVRMHDQDAEVIGRTNTTETYWDEHAIRTVQMALIADAVQPAPKRQ